MTLHTIDTRWGDNDFSQVMNLWVRQETGEPQLTVQQMNAELTDEPPEEDEPLQYCQDGQVDLECNELFLLAQQLETRGVTLEAYLMWRQTNALDSLNNLIASVIERDNAELPNYMFRAPGRE